jgi:hypothetical protein
LDLLLGVRHALKRKGIMHLGSINRRRSAAAGSVTLLVALVSLCTAAHDQQPSVMSYSVSTYTVHDATMEEALRALRATNPNQILIGFERFPHRRNESETKLSLSLSNATVEEILTALCKNDSRYVYAISDSRVIQVHPRNSSTDPPDLLNLPVHDFSVEETMTPAAVISRIGELAPELSSYLADKKRDYYAQRGILPSSPGALMHGNMDPQLKIHLRDVTVRQILNAIVSYSYELYETAKPDWTGNKQAPTSWIYDFTVDPDAPTGLGGYPTWTPF